MRLSVTTAARAIYYPEAPRAMWLRVYTQDNLLDEDCLQAIQRYIPPYLLYTVLVKQIVFRPERGASLEQVC